MDKSQISDGYHSFEELYYHRHYLFLNLMQAHAKSSWYAPKHHDGTMFEGGWFIAGIQTPAGQITYHLPWEFWDEMPLTNAERLDLALPWDGHTSSNVVSRLSDLLRLMDDK